MLEIESIAEAIKQIAAEKNLSETAIFETIESALAAAYRKDFGEKNQNIKVEFDIDTGKFKVFDVKTVIEDLPEDFFEKLEQKRIERQEALDRGEEIIEEEEEEDEDAIKYNPKTDLQISEVKEIKKTAKVGDELKIKLETPKDFGRMAAQTAKQVIIQKLREAERDVLYDEFKDKEGEILTGIVQKIEGRNILVDMGKVTGLLPPSEQIDSERYKLGDRIKAYVVSVEKGTKGPDILLSRTHEDILKQLFFLEIPEVASGAIEIKSISREGGSRAKVAVYTEDENIDPIGSCVGQRGARIQTIISELSGEKIDIIEWNEDPAIYITNALSPAVVEKIEINDEEKTAVANVKADQLSLAIGKQGQNVRLAAKLTGWKINIKEIESGKQISADDLSGKESTEAKDKKEEKQEDKKKEEKKETKEKADKKEKKEDKKKQEKKTKKIIN